MPTRNRRPFVERSLAYFARQDYPNLELIIIDEGSDPVRDLLPADPRIRYRYLRKPHTTGDKRNLGCQMARGLIIASWDDDDWYGPQRISRQVAPLLQGSADMCGLHISFLDLDRWQGWTCSPELHREVFLHDVGAGTLVFWRWVWERLASYPAVRIAEDVLFLDAAYRRGALLHKVPNDGIFVYMRHSHNTWRFGVGEYRDRQAWQALPAEALIPAEDCAFYQSYRAGS
jgi:glycosyltransferase involved in cell wall biosynthesis